MATVEDMPGRRSHHDIPFDFSGISDTIPMERWEQETSVSSINVENLMTRSSTSIPAFNGANAVSRLYDMCQRLRICPEFIFEEPHAQQFRASVMIGGQTYDIPQTFPSKKEAKVQLCEHVLPQLLGREAPIGTVAQTPSGSTTSTTSGMNTTVIGGDSNWVGILQEYTQRRRLPLPVYTYEAVSTRQQQMRGLTVGDQGFHCTVEFPGGPLLGQVFASSEGHLPSKPAAKQAAAETAVAWLNSRQSASTY